MFAYSPDQFRIIIDFILAEAKRIGASDAAAEISEGQGLSVTVRKGEVETIEQSVDKQVGVSVYLGQRRGNASTSDFSPDSLRLTVEAAFHIAQHTAEDDCAGLAQADLLEQNPQDLDLFHPWDLDTKEAIQIARKAEKAAFAVHRYLPIRRTLCWARAMDSWGGIPIQGILYPAHRSRVRQKILVRCSAMIGIALRALRVN
jgi:PmbA protein